jgi:hypothetical protein
MENYQITIQGTSIEECYLKPMVYASQSTTDTTLRILIPVANKWELDPENAYSVKQTKKTAYIYVNLIEKKSTYDVDAIYLDAKLKNDFKDYQISVVFGDPQEGGSTILRTEDIEIDFKF